MLLVRSTVPLRLLIGFVRFWANHICWANNAPPGQIALGRALLFEREKIKVGEITV